MQIKILQHELACTIAVLKVKGSELEVILKLDCMNLCLLHITCFSHRLLLQKMSKTSNNQQNRAKILVCSQILKQMIHHV